MDDRKNIIDQHADDKDDTYMSINKSTMGWCNGQKCVDNARKMRAYVKEMHERRTALMEQDENTECNVPIWMESINQTRNLLHVYIETVDLCWHYNCYCIQNKSPVLVRDLRLWEKKVYIC